MQQKQQQQQGKEIGLKESVIFVLDTIGLMSWLMFLLLLLATLCDKMRILCIIVCTIVLFHINYTYSVQICILKSILDNQNVFKHDTILKED
jgi:hypothetical protein